MDSPSQPISKRRNPPLPPSLPPLCLTDDLLAEIFLRLPSLADLTRASVVSVSFRRIITDPSFLGRFRSLHQPPFLGLLTVTGFHPALPPHPSSPPARALASAADFSFSFLPSPGNWRPCDARDGRVLLDRITRQGAVFMELVVCDPLSRRYVILPPVPGDLAAAIRPLGSRDFGPFLAPGRDDEELTSFTVIFTAQCETKLAAFVFSSRAGQWRALASPTWSDLRGPGLVPRRHCAYGCFYWKVCGADKLLSLDTFRFEFSSVDLPPYCNGHELSIVEAGEGRLGMFAPRHLTGRDTPDLYYTVMQNEGEGTDHWQLENIIPLPLHCSYQIMGAARGYLLLLGWRINCCFGCFSLEIKTLQLETVCKMRPGDLPGYLYTGFPPLSSAPSI